MIITTTPQIDGKKIVEYKSLVFGEIVMGADFIKDLKAGFTNFFGGRSQAYEEEFINARMAAINEMHKRAAEMGANAVVGAKVDYETLGSNGSNMMMVVASGTAVVVE